MSTRFSTIFDTPAVPPSHLRRPPTSLSVDDRGAAEALVATMARWEEAELADYRASVLADLAALGDRPVRGFLAAEIAALTALDPGLPLQ